MRSMDRSSRSDRLEESVAALRGWYTSADHGWYTSGDHEWYTSADHGWYTPGGYAWYILGRSMTLNYGPIPVGGPKLEWAGRIVNVRAITSQEWQPTGFDWSKPAFWLVFLCIFAIEMGLAVKSGNLILTSRLDLLWLFMIALCLILLSDSLFGYFPFGKWAPWLLQCALLAYLFEPVILQRIRSTLALSPNHEKNDSNISQDKDKKV